MRVGLNATCFNDRPSGAKQRFLGIYGALIRRRTDIDFIIYEPADCRVGSWFEGAPNVSVRPTPLASAGGLGRALAGLAYWRRALGRDRPDLFEVFHLPLIRSPVCPTILTVHDARPVLNGVPRLRRLFNGGAMRYSLRRADRVITVSDTMKRELQAIEPRARVTTVYNGIDPEPFANVAAEEARRTRAALGLPDNFLLAVGHLEARKNYPVLLQALAMMRQRGRSLPLVIVGNDGGAGAEIQAEIERHGLSDQIKILRGVSDRALAHLYALCDLLIFPSAYEGFGIPILEAMAARRPLVLSDTAVFQELTEGQAAYFPLHDPGALAARIEELLSSPALRQRQIAYGEQRVGAFGFDALARRMEQIYDDVLRAGSR